MLFLGIDIGTTGTKSILTDENATIIKHSYKGYGLTMPHPGWVEQNPMDWWEAVKFTVKECLSEESHKIELRSLSISAQGGSIAFLDRNGKLLGDAVTWLDTRAKECREWFVQTKGEAYYHKRTGLMLGNGLAMQTAKWLQDNEPERFQNTAAIYSTLDFINYKLTGKAVIDPSCASLNQLLNVRGKCWDAEILDLIGLDESKLAIIMPSGSVIGKLTTAAAAELDLPLDIDVVCGGLDQGCMALGIGAVNNGDMVLSTGTAWVMLAITDRPDINENLKFSIIPHVVGDKWGFLGSIPSAGASLDWLRDKLLSSGDTESYKDMDQKIAERVPGAKGIAMYPFFSDFAGGIPSQIIGLTLAHDRYDILRAYMESIGYEVKYMIDALGKVDFRQERLKATGGASRSPVWMGILSSILNQPVSVESNPDAACIGAARLAMIGAGVRSFADFNQPETANSVDSSATGANAGTGIGRHIVPDPQDAGVYKDLYKNYIRNRH